MRVLTAIFILAALTLQAQKPVDSFYYARSAGKLIMLASSLGEDRLGSAKLGYIDTAVLLKIIDSTKEMYHVQLSKMHKAYINKHNTQKDTVTNERPYYLTNSYSVKGDEVFDYVNINLEEKIAYKSWMEINPAKIMLEMYGVQSNTNWITQLKTVKEIKNVYLNQVEDDVVRVTIELNHQQHWGYSVNYKNKTLSIRVRRQPENLKLNKLLVAIDAGHGGSNNGAVGVTTKSFEKNYTLRFANELEKLLLSKDVAVIMTRTSDTNVTNVDRVVMLQRAMPDLLVSLHLNSSANPNVKGV